MVMRRALLFILFVCSATTAFCSPVSTAHKMIMAGMAAPGLVVMISLVHKTVKKIAQTTETPMSTHIKDATTNNCHWLRPQ